MNRQLPEEAVEFGASAQRAFAALGGVDLAREAQLDPDIRTTRILPTIERLGLADLRVGDDLEIAIAAGQFCRAAGRVALPYPVVASLGASLVGGLPLTLVDPNLPRADHGDLFPEWLALGSSGGTWLSRPRGDRLASTLGPFVVDLELVQAGDEVSPWVRAMVLVLAAQQALGALEQALELTRAHVTSREQFGRALASFQSIQFQLADAVVAVSGLRELANFTLWRLFSKASASVVDALALHAHLLDVTRAVLGTCHQLHGALGFCDEHDLSILSRHVRPLLWLSDGGGIVTRLLFESIESQGFDGVFSVAGSEGSG